MKRLSPLPGEFEIIRRYFAPLANHPGALGLRDDAAVLASRPGFDQVLTVDALIADVHFIADDPADLVARKALRVNLSDLAAMGAAPVGYLLVFAINDAVSEDWIDGFARGLAHDQAAFGVSLLGGDTVRMPGPVTISITAIGEVEADPADAMKRSGARPGDTIFVSGTIGDAALGLGVIRGAIAASPADGAYLAGRYRLPEPRLALGRRLRGIASAAMDVSDGLIADLAHLASASNCGATIELARVPLSLAARGLGDRYLSACVTGGDDYELLFTASPERAGAIADIARDMDLPLTAIGDTTSGTGVSVLDSDGNTVSFDRGGYRHF
jgi:thiamine-monophosphate kinase